MAQWRSSLWSIPGAATARVTLFTSSLPQVQMQGIGFVGGLSYVGQIYLPLHRPNRH